jgi:predicted metal-binding membrane protein
MDAMPMPGGDTMSPWMPMCGQSWIGAAAAFLGMWTVMMAAMMLPSLVPTLWRHRRSLGGAGELPAPLGIPLFAGGYLLVWTLLGVAVYPLGAATMAVTMRYGALERAFPIATGLLVLAAGALQLTRWRARHLICCRNGCHEMTMSRRSPAADACRAWIRGLRLGLHCSQCCAGLTAVLLVTGIMDLPIMLAVTAAITLERLAPGGERIARLTGIAVIAAGLFLTGRAVGRACGT